MGVGTAGHLGRSRRGLDRRADRIEAEYVASDRIDLGFAAGFGRARRCCGAAGSRGMIAGCRQKTKEPEGNQA